ncbi:MAG: DUF4286 family protein [Ignavibacteria bacterium]|nr:DUF4286 family protein [Ignavibacteria bacterium]
MLVYNVTINVDDSIHDEWVEWMTSVHVPQVIATKCFKNYSMHRMLSPEHEEGTKYVMKYICDSVEDYERYQIEHAALLQHTHKEKFGGNFTAIRSLMEEV